MKFFAELYTMIYFHTSKSSRLTSRPGKAPHISSWQSGIIYKQPLSYIVFIYSVYLIVFADN